MINTATTKALYRRNLLAVAVFVILPCLMTHAALAQKIATNTPVVQPVDPYKIVAELAPGWNLGNSLESMGPSGRARTSQETAWGNPPVTQKLMNAVRDAGFKSVRIPVSWAQYTRSDGKISPEWIARVREVIGYARKAGLYVIVNEHWDGGWLQPTSADRDRANAKLAGLWSQIAAALQDQDDHVLFAGTNEVMVKDDWSEPNSDNCEVQSGFNQVFVDAVRATGGNNVTRWLVAQGFNTNINYTLKCNSRLPTDTTPNRLMMEVHFYDPYNFTLNAESKIWQWGEMADKPDATEDWADEAYVDTQFAKIKQTFVDKGIPVILGEYAANLRLEHDNEMKFRDYWDLYITYAAVRHGMVPIYWDNGYIANHQSGLFSRGNGILAFPLTATMIVEGVKEGMKRGPTK